MVVSLTTGGLLARLLGTGRYGEYQASFMGRQVDLFFNAGNDPESLPPDRMWASQPHLRTVIDFRARQVAHLGLHLFRDNAGERERVRDSELALVLEKPNRHMTGPELIYDLVATKSLWDEAFWFVYQGPERMEIQPFPPSWVKPVADDFDSRFAVRRWRVQPPGEDRYVEADDSQVVHFRGWSALSPTGAVSPVETLRLILEEQHHARKHRLQLWRKNGRVGSYISRPKDAPQWDPSARKRFYEMFEAFTGDKGERAGGVPLLEDGMELKRNAFTSADEQWADSVKLSLETVAQVYQVNPTMVGVLDNANYSNVREFNKQLYTNTLGPEIKLITSRINSFVLPLLGAAPGEFAEFNVEEKLRGSFEEQASVLSTSVGAPWLTRNEARRKQNLPDVAGGDELIIPLNVAEGGQASPQDGGDGRPADEVKAVAGVWAKCLQRQAAAVPAKMGGPDWWDGARWDRELTADLAAAGVPDPGSVAVSLNEQTKAALDGRRDDPVTVFNALLQGVAS